MSIAVDTTLPATSALSDIPAKERTAVQTVPCYHCGEPCRDTTYSKGDRNFCCNGCQIVHELLSETGMGQFYDLAMHPGVRVAKPKPPERFQFLDDPTVQRQLLDFSDGRQSRITLHIPGIHCVACVWLLENLFRLASGIGSSRVNFARREVSITFENSRIQLSALIALLCSLGYEPSLTLGELGRRGSKVVAHRKQWLQLGLAAFGFGNIMLLSLPLYMGLDSLNGPQFRSLFGYLSLALAAPVVFYSASDYWRTAWTSLRQRTLTLDVPIAAGLAALYLQSVVEIVSGHGEGYLDSLAGLVFFLLCGRVFQRITNERLAFDRDYKCFFPLAVARKSPGSSAAAEHVSISSLKVGDHIVVRNGELIPADALLVSGDGLIDYSFVTGEAEPVSKHPGDYIYAGGRQIGTAVELETTKPVSQSYLTSLWDHEAFRKERRHDLQSLTNRYSRRFTVIVLAVALGAAACWAASGHPGTALKAFISVLIVACPCALALAAPFTLGTAQRSLARLQVFFKNALVVERLAIVDTIVFDKTGTLTATGTDTLSFVPSQEVTDKLSESERHWVSSLATQSPHPLSTSIATAFHTERAMARVADFQEAAGLGTKASVEGHPIVLGSAAWLAQNGIQAPHTQAPTGTCVLVAIDGRLRGWFIAAHALRPDTDQLLTGLSKHYELALLSGDNEKERERFLALFGPSARLHFNQSPLDKLGFIERLQKSGKNVMMVGDGLNDAGALKQADVGVAVVENVGCFSPASDVILAAGMVPRLHQLMALARASVRIVRLNFAVSALYNLIGISIAAAGVLSPVICAILMPLSSASVVLMACGAAGYAFSRSGLKTMRKKSLMPQPGSPAT